MSDTILTETRGTGQWQWRVLTLYNPGERNAVTGKMRRELMAALADAAAAPTVRAVLLRGDGDRAFCAGGSMADMAALETREDCLAMCREGIDLLNALRDFPKPLLAAVSGWCVGDGFELALCCDLILASETAVFTMPEVDLGLTMGWGGAMLLEERLGLARTREILMLGTRLTAGEALSMGLINRVLPPEEIFAGAEALTETVAKKPPLALGGDQDPPVPGGPGRDLCRGPGPGRAAGGGPDDDRGFPRSHRRLPGEADSDVPGKMT